MSPKSKSTTLLPSRRKLKTSKKETTFNRELPFNRKPHRTDIPVRIQKTKQPKPVEIKKEYIPTFDQLVEKIIGTKLKKIESQSADAVIDKVESDHDLNVIMIKAVGSFRKEVKGKPLAVYLIADYKKIMRIGGCIEFINGSWEFTTIFTRELTTEACQMFNLMAELLEEETKNDEAIAIKDSIFPLEENKAEEKKEDKAETEEEIDVKDLIRPADDEIRKVLSNSLTSSNHKAKPPPTLDLNECWFTNTFDDEES